MIENSGKDQRENMTYGAEYPNGKLVATGLEGKPSVFTVAVLIAVLLGNPDTAGVTTVTPVAATVGVAAEAVVDCAETRKPAERARRVEMKKDVVGAIVMSCVYLDVVASTCSNARDIANVMGYGCQCDDACRNEGNEVDIL